MVKLHHPNVLLVMGVAEHQEKARSMFARRPPKQLFVVAELMERGSLFDAMHKSSYSGGLGLPRGLSEGSR